MAPYNVKAHPAFAGYDLPEAQSLRNEILRLLRKLAAWSEARRTYQQVTFELSALSDRDLADVGISRAGIPAVAHQAAKAASAER